MTQAPDTHVRLTAVLRARAGQESALRDVLLALVQQVVEEPGCIQYSLHANPGRPGEFVFYEVWADQAALDVHAQAPALRAAGPRFADLLAEPPVLTPLVLLR
ncbi:putative quinol monooxygenase [Chitinimonas naiadis]